MSSKVVLGREGKDQIEITHCNRKLNACKYVIWRYMSCHFVVPELSEHRPHSDKFVFINIFLKDSSFMFALSVRPLPWFSSAVL